MRRVLFITGSRGEWGYIRPVLRRIRDSQSLVSSLVVTNMHLLPEFGASLQEIRNDGFAVDEKIYMALDGYTDSTMAKSLGVFLLSFVDVLDRLRPDFILLAGDRGEQLMAAIGGAHLNVAIAHIQAGEVSGNVDGQTRHAIARYAHIHFAANQDAADRLRRTGEQEFRVFTIGAPQLDDFLEQQYERPEEVARRFRIDLQKPVLLMLQHPVTEQVHEAADQVATTLQALFQLQYQTVLIYPNNDAGSAAVRQKIADFRGPWLRVERNVSRSYYAGLMRVAAVMVGNSSSGLIEAPSFELPVVNIGRRQIGRVQAKNVINADHKVESILQAIGTAMSPGFRASLMGMPNPYGDGKASRRIVDVLSTIPLDERLLFKSLTY